MYSGRVGASAVEEEYESKRSSGQTVLTGVQMLPIPRLNTRLDTDTSQSLAGNAAADRPKSVSRWRIGKKQWQGERSRMLGDGSERTYNGKIPVAEVIE